MKKFWNWIRNEAGEREMFIEGPIAEESWWGDEITPEIFREELNSGNGPIKIHVNSPGGECFAASKIYTMLMEYPSDVTVQIDGVAASAASVIAMAGTHVQMSPTAMLMIHNPATVAFGDKSDMEQAIAILDEVKESIINAYQIKTGLSRQELATMMDAESWMNARKAKELGFCDEVLFEDGAQEGSDFFFSSRSSEMVLINRIRDAEKAKKAIAAEAPVAQPEEPAVPDNSVNAADLEKRLLLLK